MLLGRGAEVTRLEALVRDAADGRGGALVIEGAPGVGKTALIEEAARRAEQHSVLRIAGVESERALPYAALQQLCGRMIEHRNRLPAPQSDALAVALGGAAGAAPDRFLVSLGVLGLLSDVAGERPLVCLIDDAQWIDQDSLQALAFVARRIDADPVVLIFSTRASIEGLEGIPRLVIEGLGESDSRDLLSSVVPGRLDPRVRDRIVAETHGNPLALIELPHGLSVEQLAGGFGLPDPQGLSSRIEEGFLGRANALPPVTQQVLLLVAADPVGDASVLRRAARTLGVDFDEDIGPAETSGLISVSGQIRFRHPLVRSAIYRAASSSGRRRTHSAIADALDTDLDRDRRAWHLAHGTVFPDDEVASELVLSADRANSRGGPAAAAAFLELAASLVSDAGHRTRLTVACVESKYDAGALRQAAALLDGLDTTRLDEAESARLDLIRARILFTTGGSGETVVLLTGVAKRLESVNPDVARATYLHAFSAGSFLGRDVAIDEWLDLGRAALAAPPSTAGTTARDLLLEGLALQLAKGFSASLGPLRSALEIFVSDGELVDNQIEVLWLACCIAIVVWDDAAWQALSARFVDEGHRTGAIVHLLAAVQMRAVERVLAGDLAAAASLVEEKNQLASVIGPTHAADSTTAFLWAWLGREPADALAQSSQPQPRLWGFEADLMSYSTAVRCNASGHYREAMEASRDFLEDANGRWAPALPELVEAAMRCEQYELARQALDQLIKTTTPSGTDWALGIESLCRALVSDDTDAEPLFVECLERLSRTRIVTATARAKLLYGEWLRRQGRRIDAREQLRASRELFLEMGAEGFAGRAERELLATGEKSRQRIDSAREQLTPQEQRIAELTRAGFSNAEIGAQLYLSRRTIEYHLHKVFVKLGVSTRTQLALALSPEAPNGSG